MSLSIDSTPSGNAYSGTMRKVVLLAKAAHCLEDQFVAEVDVRDCLAHKGPVHIDYYQYGDDDGVVATFVESGARYRFDEVSVNFVLLASTSQK